MENRIVHGCSVCKWSNVLLCTIIVHIIIFFPNLECHSTCNGTSYLCAFYLTTV